MSSSITIITGAGGFLGRELCRQSIAEGLQVIGIDLVGVPPEDDTPWYCVSNNQELSDAILNLKPTTVIHAAFRNRKPTGCTEVDYWREALDAAALVASAARQVGASIVLVSSSAVYGGLDNAGTLVESSPRSPVSTYGVAKSLCEDVFSYYYVGRSDLHVVRLFNLIGPTPQAGMLLTDWVSQAVRVKQGYQREVSVIHRRTFRDFVDVRDAARAIILVAVGGSRQIYNVASGDSVSLMDLSAALEDLAGIPLSFSESQSHTVGASDVRRQQGSYDCIAKDLAWYPMFSWKSTVQELWDYFSGITLEN